MHALLRVLLICLSLAPGLASAKIYKLMLPDGTVIYSDRPQVEGAKALELPPLQTYSAPPTPAAKPAPAAEPTQDPESAKKAKPPVLKVLAPKADEAIRANGGTIEVKIAVEPALRPGDVLDIVVDGKVVASGRATNTSVNGLDRGPHTLSAQIKDGEGTIVATASAVNFHLIRSSKLQPKRAPSPPPASP